MSTTKARDADTCPLNRCRHAIVLHDRVEQPGPIVEHCTVPDCPCSGSPTGGQVAA
jgi:hypothetical protein